MRSRERTRLGASLAELPPEIIDQLTDEELELLIQHELEERSPSPYCPHIPTLKQKEFLDLDCKEAFYGGAAGGGKSDALLMAALQYTHVPGYAAMIFRKTYADLALDGALIDRALEWMGGSDANWNSAKKRWTFPSGATLQFGYLEREAQKYRYKSAEWQFIGFDELTQFTETQYRYLFSRLRRTTGIDVPLRMRGASNPGDVGHTWVKKRFITERKEDVVFVPALLQDNPYLSYEEYSASLRELDPVERERLLRGDWDVTIEGNKFKREWFADASTWPDDAERVRWWDLSAGVHDYTAGVLLSRNPTSGKYCVLDIQRGRWTPHDTEAKVKHTAEVDGIGTQVWMSQDPGQAGLAQVEHYQLEVIPGFDFHYRKETGDKAIRANPVAAMAGRGNVLIKPAEWNEAFLDEVALFPHGSHDDQVDALGGAFSVLASNALRAPVVAPVSVGVRESSPWRDQYDYTT